MSDSVEARLRDLGLELPPAPPPVANYIGAVFSHGLVFVSGHGPYRDGSFTDVGKVDSEVSLEASLKPTERTKHLRGGFAWRAVAVCNDVVRERRAL